MTLLIRKLDNRRHWDRQNWLKASDAPADALNDLRTKQNLLSVFTIKSKEEGLARVIGAYALTRDHVAHFDFAIVSHRILRRLKIDISDSSGETPDPEVNEWHIDLVNLSGPKLASFAGKISKEGQIIRYTKEEVKKSIKISLDSGHINSGKINDKMIISLQKYGLIL